MIDTVFQEGVLEKVSPEGRLRCLCGGEDFAQIFHYDSPPPGERFFKATATVDYSREIWRCNRCSHFLNVHHWDLEKLYQGDYVSSTYEDAAGLRRVFERLNALAPEASDNRGRVARILEFAANHWTSRQSSPGERSERTVLDIGSGLCVFLHRMKQAGWEGTALDPDPRAVRHAQEVAGVRAICGDLLTVNELGRFDAVTLNKVLEHVKDPKAMLVKALQHVNADGFLYLEVPDGERAFRDGPNREEFFVDHWHIFSAESLAHLIKQAGGSLQIMERLREPSGKYTFRSFLIPAHDSSP